ncbi:GDP-mannose-dependent alpha-(1-6)-phosphatidylinositol monomannoside mannosyltransferase [Stieleria neptunia]|uniref:GDP-mannose-dependent alpha-(1-6)-phosphatidylinositol monomannoside mannosyltransferase n=1 Tax=Stieleria neptunia TaxID=2527979 RepID=A0A518HQY1_9BACT|nr:glycosyltransferase [Stieleria neptunia]QDV43217.1 GDP-mannose-dependent alpha-(1-6)-phosphatidylinositol monomannoside mannosyltransferase [Stieleria neptunia]
MPASTTVNAPITKPASTARRKRVLLLTHRFPYPPNRGDRIRSYNLMRVLAESFDVTLACPHDEPVSDAELQHVQQICQTVITAPVGKTRWLRAGGSLLGGHSLTEGLFHSPTITDQVLASQQTQPFDAALVFCSSMFPYVEHDAFRDTPMIVDLVDVDSEKWRQLSVERTGPKSWIYSIESKRVRDLEHRIAEKADAITLVSDQEANLFKSTIPTTTPVHGVSNGVNTDYFRPPSQRDASATGASNPSQRDASATGSSSQLQSHPPLQGGSSEARGGSSSTSHLLFTGVLDYPPNVTGLVWFCTKILPSLRQRLPVQLTIVGRRPNQAVQDLASFDGVTLVGEVPDVRPYLHAADIAISPLKLARGIQNKVLEAMACGLPVITTTESAEGIDAIDGSEFIIADDEAAWADAICDLASDPQRRTSIGNAARDLVVNHYAWSARMQQITELIQKAVGSRRSCCAS